MSSEKKSRAQLEAENDYLRKGKHAEVASSVLNNLIKFGFSFGMVVYISKMVISLSGKTTLADINLKAFVSAVFYNHEAQVVDASFNWWPLFGSAGILFGMLGCGYGVLQLKLKRNYIRHREERYEALELRLDPQRSSSMLTKSGDTRPEDK